MSRATTWISVLGVTTLVVGLIATPAAGAETSSEIPAAAVADPVPSPEAASPEAASPDASSPEAPSPVPPPIIEGADVSFAGLTVTAPADWPVRELDGRPGCVRYDEHAVFLGDPAEPTCPAHLVGRTSTVQLLRAEPSAINDASPVVALSESGDDLVVMVGESIRAIVTVDPTDAAEALAIAASITVDGADAEISQDAALKIMGLVADAAADAEQGADAEQPAAEQPTPHAFRSTPAALHVAPAVEETSPEDTVGDPADGDPETASTLVGDGDEVQTASPLVVTTPSATGTFRGMAFDTCAAPTVEAMDAWRASSYGAIGIYIGGISASCKPNTSRNPNLTADWVTSVAAMGWKMIPIYVGLQAPGTRYSAQIATKPVKATNQGIEAAQDAVNKMAALGLGPGNPIYLDVEAWNTKSSTANAAVISFTHGWTEELHRLGYDSGFYSSAGGGIGVINSRALSNPTGFTPPDAMWYARWFSQGDLSKPKKRAKAIASAHVEAQTLLDTGFLSDASLSDTLWTKSQRGWQYLGGHLVEHDGFRINIDSNMWDAPAAPAPRKTINITTSSIPDAVFGHPYSAKITTKSGKKRFVFTATDDTMPPGMTLSSNGTLSGTVSQVGVWTFTVVVTDPKVEGKSGTKTFRIAVGFPDVSDTNAFAADIAWLANSGITTGYANGSFKPAASVTRQAMAAYLYRYLHPDAPRAPACTSKAFKDVKATDAFCGEIAWLVATGITTGYADGTFHPEAVISRQAMAAFLYRLQHPEETPTLLADQAADALVTQQRADALAAARAVLAAATGKLDTAKQAVKDAKHSDFKPKKKARKIAKAEARRATAKQKVVDARAVVAEALAATRIPLPNRDTCEIAPAGLTDIAADALFCRQISWLVSTGVTSGYADGGYRPAAAISRQAMAAFLHRLADTVPPPALGG